jgi:hypothetical protein
MNLKEVLSLLSGTLTPLIAIIAIYIAIQQFRLEAIKFRLETYERRLAIFRIVRSFIMSIVREAKVDLESCIKFNSDTAEAVFLFEKDVREYIDKLYREGIRLMDLGQMLYPVNSSSGLPVGPERSKASAEQSEIVKWFNDQRGLSEELFRKHIGIAA